MLYFCFFMILIMLSLLWKIGMNTIWKKVLTLLNFLGRSKFYVSAIKAHLSPFNSSLIYVLFWEPYWPLLLETFMKLVHLQCTSKLNKNLPNNSSFRLLSYYRMYQYFSLHVRSWRTSKWHDRFKSYSCFSEVFDFFSFVIFLNILIHSFKKLKI